jgi:hypothetical protein
VLLVSVPENVSEMADSYFVLKLLFTRKDLITFSRRENFILYTVKISVSISEVYKF